MRIVIAPDSFKECASAAEVAKALAAGVSRACPEAETVLVPMADGGEGTVDAMVAATSGQRIERTVTGPLGDPVDAVYGVLGDGETAVIEMAAASGFALVPPARRDPRAATTYGTGELVRDALDRGVTHIIAGIGGSATNDAGAGMAQALGYRFLDAEGAGLPPGGAALARLARIDAGEKHPRLATCRVSVACDVTNPLCGPRGASQVYGPQKGASPEEAAELDAALSHFAEVAAEAFGKDVRDMPGAGAAGGLGAGLALFAGAELREGALLVAEACGLEAAVEGADLVLTGEGRLDAQTLHGKAPAAVAASARKHGVPAVAVAGALQPGYEALYQQGLTAAFSLCPGPMPPSEAISRAEELLSATAESIMRLWFHGRR